MTNPISDLLASGYADALIGVCAHGEGTSMMPSGIKSTGSLAPEVEGVAGRLQAAARDVSGSASLWCTVSTDGRRVDGEVVLLLPDGRTSITWDLRTTKPTLRLSTTRQATFASMVDLAEAVVDHAKLFEAMRMRGEEIADALSGLGYRLDWRPDERLSHHIEVIDLVEA